MYTRSIYTSHDVYACQVLLTRCDPNAEMNCFHRYQRLSTREIDGVTALVESRGPRHRNVPAGAPRDFLVKCRAVSKSDGLDFPSRNPLSAGESNFFFPLSALK